MSNSISPGDTNGVAAASSWARIADDFLYVGKVIVVIAVDEHTTALYTYFVFSMISNIHATFGSII